MLVRATSAGLAPSVEPGSAPPPPPPPPPSREPDRILEATPIARPAAATRSVPADPTTFAGLTAAVEDARVAALRKDDGPRVPTSYAALHDRLGAAARALPEAYRDAVARPLVLALERMGPAGLARLLASDPDRTAAAGLFLDLAASVLQRGEGHLERPTAAFQEVVSDLYEGFLSAEDRQGVKPPDRGVLPPLVRWGSAESGPYTWPADDTATFGAGAAVVSLPAANAKDGLLAWAALAHETAGHDVLSADEGLRDELAEAVRRSLLEEKLPLSIADYFAKRIDETAADVLGVLNMGPAAAVGLIGYFRALHGAWSGRPALRNVGAAEDAHPADLVRAYVAAETVRLLSFEGAGRWADRLLAEADRDLGQLRLGRVPLTADDARRSARAVARAIVRTRVKALEGRALGEIQDWRDRDEVVVAGLRRALATGGAGGRAAAGSLGEGAFAAHAVAAAVYEAVSGAGAPDRVMDRMIALVASMHARNRTWNARAA